MTPIAQAPGRAGRPIEHGRRALRQHAIGGLLMAAPEDVRRTGRLLLWPDLPDGVDPEGRPELARLWAGTALSSRIVDAVRLKAGRLDQTVATRRLADARSALAGGPPPTGPRLLVRVDEFPHYRGWDPEGPFGVRDFERFHTLMRGAGVPYLIAVSPRVCRSPLDPDDAVDRGLAGPEVDMLRRLAADGVAFGLHGLNHRTRIANRRRRTELAGLDRDALGARLDEGLRLLREVDVVPRVLVPPYNTFGAAQWPVLEDRFEVVCGGPESVLALGFQSGPLWRGGAVYLPAYPPLYGTAGEIKRGLERLGEESNGLWLPVVLHWGWELDSDWAELRALLPLLARDACSWDDFRTALEASR